jgi:hypothetical protein
MVKSKGGLTELLKRAINMYASLVMFIIIDD